MLDVLGRLYHLRFGAEEAAPTTIDSDLDTLSPGGSLTASPWGSFRKAGTSSTLEPWATRVLGEQ